MASAKLYIKQVHILKLYKRVRKMLHHHLDKSIDKVYTTQHVLAVVACSPVTAKAYIDPFVLIF